MNIKYRVFESREDFRKAAETGDCKFPVSADLDGCSAEDFADLLLDFAENDSWPDCSESVRFFVIDGESDDVRDYSPLEGQLHRGLFERVITEFKDKRTDEDVQKLVARIWDGFGREKLKKHVSGCIPVYNHYHIEAIGKEIQDFQEAKKAALSASGSEPVFVRQGFPTDEWVVTGIRDLGGMKATDIDYYAKAGG